MTHEKIKLFIAQKGYCTLSELKSNFSDNEEILDMNLTFLVDKSRVKRVTFQGPLEIDDLFYILPE